MIEVAGTLRDAFVDAYRGWVLGRVRDTGLPEPEALAEVLDEGSAWLETELTALLALPFRDQRRGPLEIFQEAMQFPTGSLLEAGVSPVVRDEVAANALPGDLYGLAPAASHELGEEAWRAHLAWGAAKAADFVRPVANRVGVVSRNLMDRSKLESALRGAGHEVVVVRAEVPEAIGVLIVDLEHPDAEGLVASAAAEGIRTVVYGPHVDEEGMAAIRAAGAEVVLPRSQVLRDPITFVARLTLEGPD